MKIKSPEKTSPQEELEQLTSEYYTTLDLPQKVVEVAVDKKRRRVLLAVVIVCALIIAGSAYLLFDSVHVGAASAEKKYHEVKESISAEIYDTYYQNSYSFYEQQHHVSNNISISIGSLQEQAKLEVLRISEVEYVTPEEDPLDLIKTVTKAISEFLLGNVVAWLEVPGNGVFSVDLKASEFIIDNERQYVLVRIPNPELSEFTIDYANVEVLYFEDTGVFKKSARVGENVAGELLKIADLTMRQKASDQDFCLSARDSAVTILTTLIKQMNPLQPDLSVEIEFFD